MNITWTDKFADDIKFYYKKKKYLKIRDDIKTVTDKLENGNLVGDKLEGIGLPEGTAAGLPEGTAAYKVRIANSSANVGKSNGFRLLYYVAIEDDIYLLTLYSKKDDERIPSDAQIAMLIANIIQ